MVAGEYSTETVIEYRLRKQFYRDGSGRDRRSCFYTIGNSSVCFEFAKRSP